MDKKKADLDPVAAAATELRVILGKLKRKLREQYSAGDLTLSELAVLSYIERKGPATVTALAKAEGMRPQSMGATVAALETAGLIVGSANAKDGRQTIFSITPLCRKKFDAVQAAKEDWLFRSIKAKLNLREQEQLASAVHLLNRLADD